MSSDNKLPESRVPNWDAQSSDYDLTPIKRLATYGRNTFVDGDWIESPYITDSGIRLIQTGNIGVGEFIDKGDRYISQDTFEELDCTEVQPGDILISRLADPVGRACIAPDLDERMIASVDVVILRTREDIDSEYIVNLLSSEPYLQHADALCRGGTMQRLSRSMLGNIRVPIPSYSYQSQISNKLE
jgi:type I restriction enzyme S subunit